MGESRERCRYAGEGGLSRADVFALRSDAMKSPARSADPSTPRRRIKPHTRRDFLIQSSALAGAALAGNPLADAASAAASAAARKGGRIAMINSEYRFKSHAYHFGRRFMEGYEREGFHHQPSQAVVRMFNPACISGCLTQSRFGRQEGRKESFPAHFSRLPAFQRVCSSQRVRQPDKHVILNPRMEAKEWGQGNECQNLAGRITPTHRRAIASKNEVILSAVLRGRRRGGTESKDPVSARKIIKQDRTSFRHSTGFFGCAMPATCARRA